MTHLEQAKAIKAIAIALTHEAATLDTLSHVPQSDELQAASRARMVGLDGLLSHLLHP